MFSKKGDGAIPLISPWVRVAEKAQHQCVKLLIEWGMTPSSRSRVHAKPGAKKKDVNKERFFGRPRTTAT